MFLGPALAQAFLEQLLAFENRVGDGVCEHANGADGVVVAGNQIIDRIRVAVRIGDGHDRDIQLVGFVHGDRFAARIDHEHDGRQLIHIAQTAQAPFQLDEFLLQQLPLFFRHAGPGVFLVHFLEFFKRVDALFNGDHVGQRAAQPTIVDVVTTGPFGLFGDDVGRLFLRTDENHLAALGRGGRSPPGERS